VLRAAIILALALGLVVAGMPQFASAAVHKKHRKKPPASSKTTASTGKKSSKKKAAVSSRRRGKKRSSHRKAAAPRRLQQRNPTPERYKEIQEALIAKGYLKGPATGAWDADSIAAIKRFQTDQKLDADGKLESLTLIALGLGPRNSPIATNSPSPVRRTP